MQPAGQAQWQAPERQTLLQLLLLLLLPLKSSLAPRCGKRTGTITAQRKKENFKCYCNLNIHSVPAMPNAHDAGQGRLPVELVAVVK
jgi:hypothetical protein